MADVRTNLRLPEELYEEIKRLAEKELRSINAQMVILLQSAVASQPRGAGERTTRSGGMSEEEIRRFVQQIKEIEPQYELHPINDPGHYGERDRAQGTTWLIVGA